MVKLCKVGGVTLPLGPDDVRDYLAQYGEVRDSRWLRGSLSLLAEAGQEWPSRLSAYSGVEAWHFYSSPPGDPKKRELFDDLALAVAYALTGEGAHP